MREGSAFTAASSGRGILRIWHVPQPVAALPQHREPALAEKPTPLGVRLEVDVRGVGKTRPIPSRQCVCPSGQIGRDDKRTTAGHERSTPAGEYRGCRGVIEVFHDVDRGQAAERRVRDARPTPSRPGSRARSRARRPPTRERFRSPMPRRVR